MSAAEAALKTYDFHRTRTLDLLDRVAKTPDPQKVLGWRPGLGRAHIAWQLMHIGVTEEIFATERLAPHKQGEFQDLWPRFRGGSTPDDEIPTVDEIRGVLAESRAHLAATLREITDERLNEIPAGWAQRKLTHREILILIGWHEAHHQGQAHITLNLCQAAHTK